MNKIKVILAWTFLLVALVVLLCALQGRASGQETNLSGWLERPVQSGDAVQVTGVVSAFEAMLHFAGVTKEQIAILLLIVHAVFRVIRNTALKDKLAINSGWFLKLTALLGGKPLDKTAAPPINLAPIPVAMVATSPIPNPPPPASTPAISLSSLK